ncbi:MAG: hypothetical protein L3J01_04150 [Thiomicrorhabdus sp.]|nr:hypothetical protein [Thiomicrorhabdus sp.]
MPPEPPLSEFSDAAKKADIIMLIDIDLSTDPTKATVREVLYGEKAYQKHKNAIMRRLPKHEKRTDVVFAPMEIFFAKLTDDPFGIRMITSIALHKTRTEFLGDEKLVFKEHSIKAIKAAVAKGAKKAEQNAAEQPATRLQSKPK